MNKTELLQQIKLLKAFNNIKYNCLAKELSIPYDTLVKALNGQRSLPQKYVSVLTDYVSKNQVHNWE